MIRSRGPLAAAAVLGCFALPGCAGYSVREKDLERLERGELPPYELVFTCHGILYDLAFPWDFRLRDEIAEGPGGRASVVITYLGELTGVWFNWGSQGPGKLLAGLAEGLEALHRRTGCPADLRLKAVGFSAGCEAILEAASRLSEARLERVLFLNSSSFAFSGEPRRLVEEGKIGRLVCGWSPFDLATLLAPLGSGQFGIHSPGNGPGGSGLPGGEGIENRCLWNLHVPPLFAGGRRRARELLFPASAEDGGYPPPSHTCGGDAGYRKAVAELLRRGRARDR